MFRIFAFLLRLMAGDVNPGRGGSWSVSDNTDPDSRGGWSVQ